MKKATIIILFLLACSNSMMLANESSFFFSTLNLKNGLSQLSVLNIYQDSYGFMWFATRNGLNKYDGTSFVVYKHINNDSCSLSHNHVLSFIEDQNRNLWIGTISGLSCLDLKTDQIMSFDEKYFSPNHTLSNIWISDLYIDKQERLWVATNNGLYIYQPNENLFQAFGSDEQLERKHIQTIRQDSYGNILIGTISDGLYIYDKNFELTYHYKEGETNVSLTNNYVTSIYEDCQGNIWVGTKQSGLNKINSKNHTVSQYTVKNSNLGNDHIRSITSYQGKLIVGTWDGLTLIDPITTEFNRFTNFDEKEGGINHFSVYSTYVDNANTLWVGTYSGGVSYTNPLNNRFRFYDPKHHSNIIMGIFGAMDYQCDHTLWVASEGGGLLSLDLNTGEFSHYLLEPRSKILNDNNIIKSVKVENNIVWCGTQKGTLYQFDINTKKFSLFFSFQRNISIYTIIRSKDGTIWLGTTDNDGLIRISQDGKQMPPIILADSTPLVVPSIRCFLEIRENVFLIGTHREGLLLFNMNVGTLIRYNPQQEASYQIYNEHITAIERDQSGRIWIGTFGGGFYLFDEKEGIKKCFTTTDGLPDDNICCVVWGDDQKLWLSTGNGISSFDPRTGQFVNYTDRNEISMNEFSIKGGIKLPGNQICFSGSEGVLSFCPDHLIQNSFIPPIVLTSFTVNNQSVYPGDATTILKNHINSTSEVILKPFQNNLSIRYAALNYLYPYQNNYAYKLEGYDMDWNQVGNRMEAFYTNLKPGYYTFWVKASNNDGVWNDEGHRISIHILTSIWQTWYAYLVYMLLVLATIYGVYLYFHTKRKLQRDLIQKQKEQQQQEEFHQSKIRMFTNFSHELRTPLTLIISPLEEILQRVELNQSLRKTLQLIYHNTQRLLLLVNQLMDLRKNQTGNLQLRISNENLYVFVQEIYIAFNQIAEKNQVTFELFSNVAQIDAWFDRSLLEKVLFNLLSNAFKHTKAGESITIRLKEYTFEEIQKLTLPEQVVNFDLRFSHYTYIIVEDTGEGIADAEKSRIFSPFFQGKTEQERDITGTGIGLSLVLSIIRLHQGMVWIEDNQPKGSAFRILIPTDKSVYTEEQLVKETVSPVQKGEYDSVETATTIQFKQRYLVLLAEDNDEVRDYVKQRLEPFFDVLEADNGVKAFEIIAEKLPDLVISDIMMPQMDGLQLCAMVKQDLRTGHIPVIIITAKSMVMHIKEGFQCGADDYIIKPFNMDLLLCRVSNILAARERLKELYGKKFSLESMGVETTSADDRFMQRFFDVVKQNIANPSLNVDILCQEIGMGRANFYRKIKAITELSPIDLIRNKRLEIAAQMLINTNMNISEISIQVGFNSSAYFTTCFKAMYGISPTEYIQQHKS